MMNRNEKGFTLVELMVSLAVASAITAVVLIGLRASTNSIDTSNVKMGLQSAAKESLYRMQQEIRETSGSRMSITNNGNTITFTIPDPSAPVTASYAVNWGDQIKYELGTGTNSTNLIRTNITDNTTSVLAHDVTDVSFTANAANTVITVNLSVQKDLPNGRTVPETPIQLTGQARFRNS